jgi:hypothetical protein
MSIPANETTHVSHPSFAAPVQETRYLTRPEGRIGYDVAGNGALVVLAPGPPSLPPRSNPGAPATPRPKPAWLTSQRSWDRAAAHQRVAR